MTTSIELGSRVQQKRAQLGAELWEIALFSRLTPEKIEAIELGEDKKVNASEIELLAFALGTSYEYLMFGKEVTNE